MDVWEIRKVLLFTGELFLLQAITRTDATVHDVLAVIRNVALV